MFELIHKDDAKTYEVYDVAYDDDGQIYFLIFKDGYFGKFHSCMFIPKL